MRGILPLYCLSCEREGCLANSALVTAFAALDACDDCPRLLDARANYLGDAGAAALLRAAAALRWLRALDLRGTGAAAAAVRALAETAAGHPALRLVDLRGRGNAVFAASARRLLRLLRRCPRLVVRVDAADIPRALAQRLHAANKENARRERAEAAALAAAVAPTTTTLREGTRGGGDDLYYVPVARYAADARRAAFATALNAHVEAYLFAHQCVGRAAACLAADLGADSLHFVSATAAAAGPAARVRAVDALLHGLHANPFLRDELRAARGERLAAYIARLAELRGEHDAFIAERRGNCPSSRERRAEAAMQEVYTRVAAGITQGAMTDLPSMRHVEERLREVREEVINRLLEGRARVLPVLLAQAKYFAFNHAADTEAWANTYTNNAALQFPDPPRSQLPRSESDASESSDKETMDRDEEDMCNESTSTLRSSVNPDEVEEEKTPKQLMCVAAMDDLRAMLDDPLTTARLAVTLPLAEALPREMRFFLCDLALRRGAGLFVPPLLGPERMVGGVGDPPDIISIFSQVDGRSRLSDVLCAFDEWYRLRQIECFDVTHVSRKELLSRMSEM